VDGNCIIRSSIILIVNVIWMIKSRLSQARLAAHKGKTIISPNARNPTGRDLMGNVWLDGIIILSHIRIPR
jgi:hypothetical protein